MDERLKWSLDGHALHKEVRNALLAHFSLAELLLFGEGGGAILPLAYLQEKTESQHAYHLYLASDSLLFLTDPGLARARGLDLARAQYRNFDQKTILLLIIWLNSFSTVRMIRIVLISPQQACKQLEQLADTNAEFKALFKEDWFPCQGLKQSVNKPFQVEPVEALSHRLYQQLKQALQSAGDDISNLPEHIALKPGDAMRTWHGDAAADKFLEDLKIAGWDVDTEPWPPKE